MRRLVLLGPTPAPQHDTIEGGRPDAPVRAGAVVGVEEHRQ